MYRVLGHGAVRTACSAIPPELAAGTAFADQAASEAKCDSEGLRTATSTFGDHHSGASSSGEASVGASASSRAASRRIEGVGNGSGGLR
mmetsp:Transcript_50184/g.144324  ORF Transcript_50184/g.144324 Transcript_50184/m.144324 type:complete len:89 (-) Transcript_50184:509-775(-)